MELKDIPFSKILLVVISMYFMVSFFSVDLSTSYSDISLEFRMTSNENENFEMLLSYLVLCCLNSMIMS